MAEHTVVILGGGAGGLVAARHLRRLLDPADRVVVVDPRRPADPPPPARPSLASGQGRVRAVRDAPVALTAKITVPAAGIRVTGDAAR